MSLRRFRVASLAASVLLVAVGCTVEVGGSTPTTTEEPTTTLVDPPGNVPPVIASFAASQTSGPSPITVAFPWSVYDPDGDPIVCTLDLDNDGLPDMTVTACRSSSIRSTTFSTIGSHVVTLSVSDGIDPAVTSAVTVDVGPPSADAFAITVRLAPGMTSTQQAAFTMAAARWEQVVRTGLSDVPTSLAANDCGTGAPAFSGTIDDVMIDAAVTSIDGVGGILGQAGPCWIRSTAGLPYYGAMKFDVADVATLEADGQLNDVILHEMGHVLGIGTTWSATQLLGAGTTDPRFAGPNAIGAWQAIGGVSKVPVESLGGPGTADSHWRESVFNNELMTGYLNAGVNPLSAITIGSLADMGYGVTLAAADSYGLPALRASTQDTGLKINVTPIVPRVR